MITSFRLPDLGEGVHEAEILTVAVSTGQAVREGDLILEVETDKAAVEIPSPVTGTITEIHISPGERAKVGDVLISFLAEGGGGRAGKVAADADVPPPASLSAPLPSTDVSTKGAAAQPCSTQPAPAPAPAAQIEPSKNGPVPAAPSTRRLARELGVDLGLITPTGAGGVVTADDVRQYADLAADLAGNAGRDEQRGLSQADLQPDRQHELQPVTTSNSVSHAPIVVKERDTLPDFSQFGPIERRPFRSIRRATAQRMATSWAQIPHVNCQDVVDITRLEAFRQRHKDEIKKAGGRLTMTVFALKAVATALKSYPDFNATLDLANQEIIIKKYFNIGVAVDTEHGLMVPVIRDVDRKSIKELAVELHEAIVRARERKSVREELIGGSFTITNAGAIGGSHFSAIINHPEIAILGLGQGRMQPAVITDEQGNHTIVPRLQMPVVLCFDHRVADGGDAIRFMQVIINSLQDPDELLLTMI